MILTTGGSERNVTQAPTKRSRRRRLGVRRRAHGSRRLSRPRRQARGRTSAATTNRGGEQSDSVWSGRTRWMDRSDQVANVLLPVIFAKKTLHSPESPHPGRRVVSGGQSPCGRTSQPPSQEIRRGNGILDRR